jgi:hypothetical protein
MFVELIVAVEVTILCKVPALNLSSTENKWKEEQETTECSDSKKNLCFRWFQSMLVLTTAVYLFIL